MNESHLQKDAEYWIEKLNLKKHVEGGYYNEIYRSQNIIKQENLPIKTKSDRCFVTSIYYLLKSGQKSLFHKIKSDEVWHFFNGSPLKLLVVKPDKLFVTYTLGNDIDNKEVFQVAVPAGSWIAATPVLDDSYSLLGCTVAPGFEFSDLEIASRDYLFMHYPHLYDIIMLYTEG